MATKILVGETYMADGIDLIHEWSSVEEAWESGRLDFLEDFLDDDEEFEEIKKSKSVQELIEKVSYPFYFVD